MTTSPIPFTNPYAEIPPNRVHRTSINIDKNVWSYLHTVHGKSGTLQTTINILLSKLHERLLANNVTSFDPDRVEFAIANASIVLPGDAAQRPGFERSIQAPSGYDTGGTGRVEQPPAGLHRIATDAAIAPAQRTENRRRKGVKST